MKLYVNVPTTDVHLSVYEYGIRSET